MLLKSPHTTIGSVDGLGKLRGVCAVAPACMHPYTLRIRCSSSMTSLSCTVSANLHTVSHDMRSGIGHAGSSAGESRRPGGSCPGTVGAEDGPAGIRLRLCCKCRYQQRNTIMRVVVQHVVLTKKSKLAPEIEDAATTVASRGPGGVSSTDRRRHTDSWPSGFGLLRKRQSYPRASSRG